MQQRGAPESRLPEFYGNQSKVLPSFVWCLIFVPWWTRGNPQFTSLLFHLHNRVGLYLFFLLLRLKMLFTHLTVGWAAFQLAVYGGISQNNHATQVKCLQSFKHFILRASSGNRQARQKKIKNKKTGQKNANEPFGSAAKKAEHI